MAKAQTVFKQSGERMQDLVGKMRPLLVSDEERQAVDVAETREKRGWDLRSSPTR
jgi:hypothetical protein